MQQLFYDSACYHILYYDSELHASRTDKFTGWTNQPPDTGTPIFGYGYSGYMALQDASLVTPPPTAAAATPGAPGGSAGPTASTPPSGTPTGSSTTPLLIGAAVVLLLVIGGGLYFARRRAKPLEEE